MQRLAAGVHLETDDGELYLVLGPELLLTPAALMLAFGLFTFFIVALIYRKRWTTALGVAAGTAFGFYLVFTSALGVELPVGMFGF